MSQDEDLLRRLLSGDPSAAEELTAKVRRLVLGLARSRFGLDGDTAQELLQMSVVRLWENDLRALRAWRGNGRLTTYLTVIVSHLWFRERARRARRADALAHAPVAVPPSPTTPADHLAKRDRRRAIEVALATLRPRDRLLLTLRFVDERSPKEMAQMLCMKKGTVRKAVHDAVRRLHRCLGEQAPELVGTSTKSRSWRSGAANEP